MNINLSPGTYERLGKFAKPLESGDAVIARLLDGLISQKEIPFALQSADGEPGASSAFETPSTTGKAVRAAHPGPKVRDYNKDILANYLRGPYVGVTYRLACYDLLSRYSRPKPIPWIVTRLFKFPFDNMRETRTKRAANSLKIALKEYTLKIGEDKLFTEPKPWFFTIDPSAATPAPESK